MRRVSIAKAAVISTFVAAASAWTLPVLAQEGAQAPGPNREPEGPDAGGDGATDAGDAAGSAPAGPRAANPEDTAEGTAPPPLGEPGAYGSAAGAGANIPPLEANAYGAKAGWHERFYLRSKDDGVRLYPGVGLYLDASAAAGTGVSDVGAQAGGAALNPRIFVQRARLEMSGEIARKLAFTMQVDLGAGALPSAATGASARFGGSTVPASSIAVANAFVDYEVCQCVHVLVGQVRSPLSMENRTDETSTSFTERSVVTRGLVAPLERDIGAMLWGDLKGRMVSYEVGLFSGDGPNRVGVDARADLMGRVVLRTGRERKAGASEGVVDEILRRAQIGVAGRYGQRDTRAVTYDVPAITTSGGFALWQPGYVDSFDRPVRVLPSGSQAQVGGELRVPFDRFDVRGELHWVEQRTREAIVGSELTNTERFGRLRGIGAMAEAGVWLTKSRPVPQEPGEQRPVRIDLQKRLEPESDPGINVVARYALVKATYVGASRNDSTDDPFTPGAEGDIVTPSNVTVAEVGLAVNYWLRKNFRATVQGLAYDVPSARREARTPGGFGNLASVPGTPLNFNWMFELGGRVAVTF